MELWSLFVIMFIVIAATSLFSTDDKNSNEGSIMVKKIFAQTYLWILLLLLYSPIVIIVIYSFTEAKVLGNWTGFSTKLYSSLFTTGAHHSLMNALINTIHYRSTGCNSIVIRKHRCYRYIQSTRSRKAIGFM